MRSRRGGELPEGFLHPVGGEERPGAAGLEAADAAVGGEGGGEVVADLVVAVVQLGDLVVHDRAEGVIALLPGLPHRKKGDAEGNQRHRDEQEACELKELD